MPKKYQKAKSSKKKSTTTKPFEQLREGKFQKYTENIKNCQSFKEATKRPKGAKKKVPQKSKKVSLYQKITKNQVYQIPKMIEFAKITFYNDKKKMLTTSKNCLKTKNGTRFFSFKIARKCQ